MVSMEINLHGYCKTTLMALAHLEVKKENSKYLIALSDPVFRNILLVLKILSVRGFSTFGTLERTEIVSLARKKNPLFF